VQSRKARFIIVLFELALLILAGLVLINSKGVAEPPAQGTPTPTLSSAQRLAKPTLPANPSQADYGAQDYWLNCLPCHGDIGQGLTDEFVSAAYPPEDQYCWERGCHGERPYENGFTLPTTIPALVGPDVNQKFSNAYQLYSYIHATMPYWKPGSLSEDEVWRITAFLLRENGLWDDNGELGEANAADVNIPLGISNQADVKKGTGRGQVFLLGLGIFILVVIFVILIRDVKNNAPE